MTIQLVDRNTGEVTFQGVRVSRNLPCPICTHLHERQGWCLVDVARGLAICPRVESSRKIGEAGWLHGNSADVIGAVTMVRQKPAVERDMNQDWDACASRIVDGDFEKLAYDLQVPVGWIQNMGVGIAEQGYAFRMYGSNRQVIGIKLRCWNGNKLCVKGSRLGLIIPKSFDYESKQLVITEGESDCAVASGWGLNAVGRAGCMASVQQLVDMGMSKNVVIVADNDEAGLSGARRLRDAMRSEAESCVVLTPPEKDLRRWHISGATTEDFTWRMKSVRGY